MTNLASRGLIVRVAHAGALALFFLLMLGLRAEHARAQDVRAPTLSNNGRADARAPNAAPLSTEETPASAGPGALDGQLEQQVRALALAGSGAAPAGVTRVEVAVGQLDPRLHLAPCQRVEPYLPTNARLWGKTRIGLKCVQGPSPWNVYLPITVKAFGRALVANGATASGSVLKSGDLSIAEVDLAEDAAPVVLDPEQAVGRVLAQSLRPGQALRSVHLKPRLWFAAGDTVKIVAVGAGFSLEGEAQALSNGIEGQPARVRTENGRVLTGQPVADHRIELAL